MWGKKTKESGAPPELTLLNGAMALDGGSTELQARSANRKVVLSLDWSLDAQQSGATQFSVDGRAVPKRSPEESLWLNLVRRAAARLPAFDPHRPMTRGGLFLLPPEDLAYFKAMEQGPEVALRVLAERFANLIESEPYAAATRSEDADVRALVKEGRRAEAVQVYRAAHPEASTTEARAAVERIAAEIAREDPPA